MRNSPGRIRFTFRLTSPPSSNIAPPGNYLLFAIDDREDPSVGRFIRIDREFVGELTQEAEDVTVGKGKYGAGIIEVFLIRNIEWEIRRWSTAE